MCCMLCHSLKSCHLSLGDGTVFHAVCRTDQHPAWLQMTSRTLTVFPLQADPGFTLCTPSPTSLGAVLTGLGFHVTESSHSPGSLQASFHPFHEAWLSPATFGLTRQLRRGECHWPGRAFPRAARAPPTKGLAASRLARDTAGLQHCSGHILHPPTALRYHHLGIPQVKINCHPSARSFATFATVMLNLVFLQLFASVPRTFIQMASCTYTLKSGNSDGRVFW